MIKEIRRLFWLFALALLFAVLHNAIYAFFGIEEPVFFMLTLVMGACFVIYLAYAVLKELFRPKKKKKQ